ncbi:MAG: hypothetical protein HJJLKODD_00303 [Phycisphaerae bacterium]|nr:hypothetical protein [Phycisphaerae bacterium]
MYLLERINKLFWPSRWLVKLLLAAVLLLLVCYPRLDRLVLQIQRFQHADRLVNPQSPALDPLVAEFDQLRQPDWDRKKLFKELEKFVYQKIRYEWDWNLWGNADYWPTVEEAVLKGQEDCDGRAVVAASMYQRYGFKSELVADFAHVWVKTDLGEAMGPRQVQGVQFTPQGWKINWKVLRELPATFCYGISVFPLWRELLLVSGWWWLCLGLGVKVQPALGWLMFVWFSLMMIRESGQKLNEPDVLLNWLGVGLAVCAYLGTIFWSRKMQQFRAG